MLPAPFASIWIVALLLAAAAPWSVRILASGLERRLARRTLDVIARAVRIRTEDAATATSAMRTVHEAHETTHGPAGATRLQSDA